MTTSQLNFAKSHDWFISSYKVPVILGAPIQHVVIVKDDEHVELEIYDFEELQSWAGY